MGCVKCDCKVVENKDTGLCATCNKLARTKPKEQKKRTPIKKQSDKRRKEVEQYNRESAEFWKGKRCAIYKTLWANQTHHTRGKNGKRLLDKKYWLPVSQKGHDFIHDNPIWAEENGYMLKRSTNEIIK